MKKGDATVSAVFERAVKDRPHHPWVIGEDVRLTYAAADDSASRMAAGMAAIGIAENDTVLVMLPDSIDVLISWLGLSRLGAVDVPINTHYLGDILVHVINDSAARVMIVGEQFLDRLVDVADRLPTLERLVVRGAVHRRLPWPASSLDEFQQHDSIAAIRMPRERDLLSVMYTSGTTGPSKGVMIAHAHACYYAASTVELLDIGRDDVIYSAGLPLFHIAGRWGVFLAAAMAGATVAMPRRFTASGFWTDVRQFGATKVFLLGSMGNFLEQQPPGPEDRNHSLLKAIVAPLPKNPREFAGRFGIGLAHAFGATEFNTPILLADATEATDAAYVGIVRSELFEVSVIDDDDQPVAPNVVGELAVRPLRPWIVTLGYWRHPEWTAKSWRNLWFHTGDLGRRDEQGRFFFLDRKTDSIRRRGENISAMEVEGVVAQHFAVRECAVFPVAASAEQEVMVAIVQHDNVTLDLVELVHFLAERMPHFMVPRFVDLLDTLPKTPTGKVIKGELRARGVSPTSWDREAVGLRLR